VPESARGWDTGDRKALDAARIGLPENTGKREEHRETRLSLLWIVLLPIYRPAQSVLLDVKLPPLERAQATAVLTVANVFAVERSRSPI
jgi:hypothetical protein